MEPMDSWVELTDGMRLHASVWLPEDRDRAPCLIEALPYRKDDITASYADTYERLAAEGSYAVCRVDLRGTGSSSGIALDEYPETEIDDLRQVIAWITSQSWCDGRVGAFGTSYSGFNSLHLAAAQIPELGAVCSFYSSDDRFTDDVHYTGGALRAIDIVDYVTYMVAMNALPPVPAVWGEGWADEWARRIHETPPWVMEWLEHPTDGPTWRRGSVRLGPDGAGYERISCPTMLVGGWADGYRNNTFRTIEHLEVPWRLLVGPWSHKDPGTARPGPNIDVIPEMIAWFDHHLRDGPSTWEPVQVFVRRHSPPEPDLEQVEGTWRQEATWPIAGARQVRAALGERLARIPDRPDVGMQGWISCAGALPWGQPLDQRTDDALSWTHEWSMPGEVEFIGNAIAHLRLRSSVPRAAVSVKLCDVAPDGASMLITRGYLDLAHRSTWPVTEIAEGAGPTDLEPDAWYEVDVRLEATAHRMTPGHRLRVAIAAADWPNIWPPSGPAQLEVDRSSSWLELPAVPPAMADPPRFVPGPGPDPTDPSVVWRYVRDVLARRTTATTHYGDTYEGRHGSTIIDSYDGEVWVEVGGSGAAGATGVSRFEIEWPEATVASRSEVSVESEADTFHLRIDLHTELGGNPFASRSFRASFDRYPW